MITHKGGKAVTVPLAPRTARTIDLIPGERSEAAARTLMATALTGRRWPLLPVENRRVRAALLAEDGADLRDRLRPAHS